MDFWDVAKLMWRRWRITVPMLLLTTVGAVWTGFTVSPSYQETTHVAVLPPTVFRNPNPTSPAAVSRVNPWTEEALADAATIRLQGKRLHDEMAAAGLKGDWSVTVTGRLPVIVVEVVAPTAEHAHGITTRLLDIVDQEVRSRQDERKVVMDEQITTVRYNDGETIDTVTSRTTRALVAVVALGLILTTALVVVFDVLVRRRERNRAAAPTSAARFPVQVSFDQAAARTVNLTHAAKAANGDGPVEPDHATGMMAPRPADIDSTIVLPLTNAPWTRGTSDKERPAGAKKS